MRETLRRAKKASALGEMPVGAVVVRDGQIIVPVSTLDTPENNRLFKPQ